MVVVRMGTVTRMMIVVKKGFCNEDGICVDCGKNLCENDDEDCDKDVDDDSENVANEGDDGC